MTGKRSEGWYDGLQALRALLFLLVFVSHSGEFMPADGAWGGAAVAVFFVLSGFLVGCREPVLDVPLWKARLLGVWRKLRKFWFLHFVVLLLLVAWYMPGRFKDFLRCALLVQSFCGKSSVALSFNWPTWFLSSLMFCYLVSPALNRFLSRFARHAAFVLPAVWAMQACWAWVWIGHPEAYGPGYYWVYICPFFRVLDFTIGMLTAKVFARHDRDLASRPAWTMLEASGVAFFAAQLVWHGWLPQTFQYSFFWMPGAALLVSVFAKCGGDLLKWTCNPVLMWMGARSFELYVIHRVVLKFLADRRATQWHWWALVLVMTCLLAEISARLIARRRHA